ncbi:MAG TPA: lysophospholipid acyltransferase family protein [Verrucomicrobiae bacterium]|nr:lysophospholipid acyltransferase family protein [Verrucomicrobiae bacterium]
MKITHDAFPGSDWLGHQEIAKHPAGAADPLERRAHPGHGAPTISRTLLGWFTWYSRRYARKHFHTVRVARNGLPHTFAGWPLVVYSNHASWWDPIVCLLLRDKFFPERDTFAPMDSAMLRRYGFFKWLGFFGVEQQTRRGAVQFLTTAQTVLESPNAILAITPQARFADVRERPIRFASGLGHLATRVPKACFLPVAIEYVFWEERLPEVLVRFGPPVQVCSNKSARTQAADWTRLFEKALQDNLEALSVEAQRRRPDDFVVLLRGGSGQGGVYDFWRWLKARSRGQKFREGHASI